MFKDLIEIDKKGSQPTTLIQKVKFSIKEFIMLGYINPILTGLFESKFQLGGGGGGRGGQIWPPPPSDLRPEGADRCKCLHGCQDTCKEHRYANFFAGKGLFNILL